MVGTHKILIDRISVNQQPTDQSRVDAIIELMEAGWTPPPITLRKVHEGQFRMIDGRHRLLAHQALGRHLIDARISL